MTGSELKADVFKTIREWMLADIDVILKASHSLRMQHAGLEQDLHPSRLAIDIQDAALRLLQDLEIERAAGEGLDKAIRFFGRESA
jgi:hypothetical protein